MRPLATNARIRPPAVAGLFYPGDSEELRATVSEHLRQAGAPAPDISIKAVIVPHAGYVYSGPIAAAAYAKLDARRHAIRRVVLIGPSHRVYLRGMAVPAVDCFRTPLGLIPIDRELRSRLLEEDEIVESDVPHAREHSLEVQLPFLQILCENFELLPLALGDATPPQVAAALAAVWGGEETLVVVSSDLSHYLPYEQAREVDAVTSRAILRQDSTLSGEQACGAVGINGLAFLARQRGSSITEIARCNSGDTAGDRTRVVGYGAFAVREPVQ